MWARSAVLGCESSLRRQTTQVIEPTNVLDGWTRNSGSMSSIPTGFRQLTIITTLIESLAVFVTSKVERIGGVVHECRAYNRDNDTGRASWCSAAGGAGNFQHWRAEPSCGEFLAGIALRCCLRLFVRRQLCGECTRSEVCAGGEWKKI